jgi:hypothetical protein
MQNTPFFTITKVVGVAPVTTPGGPSLPSANGTSLNSPAGVALKAKDAKRPHLRVVS